MSTYSRIIDKYKLKTKIVNIHILIVNYFTKNDRERNNAANGL